MQQGEPSHMGPSPSPTPNVDAVLTAEEAITIQEDLMQSHYTDFLECLELPQEGMATYASKAQTPWDIVNTKQLTWWANKNKSELLTMIHQLKAFCLQAKDQAADLQKQLDEANKSTVEQTGEGKQSMHTNANKERPHAGSRRQSNLPPPSVSSPTISPNRDPLKGIPVFTGEDPKVEFEVWKHLVTRTFSSEMNDGVEEDDRVTHLLCKISGVAAKHCLPRTRPRTPYPLFSVKDVLEHLGRRFEDNDKAANYRRQYKALYQGKRPFKEFYSELLLYAGELGYTDRQIMDDMTDKISSTLQEQLTQHVDRKEEGLHQFSIWLEKTDNANRALQKERVRKIEATNRLAKKPPVPPTNRPTYPTLNREVSKPPTADPKLPDGFKCHACGGRGHLARVCPSNLPAKAQVNEVDLDTGDEDQIPPISDHQDGQNDEPSDTDSVN